VSEKEDAARIARLIQSPGDEADRALAGLLEGAGREAIVARLLRWQDPAVRFWAIEAAERVYSRNEYLKVLDRAARDRDDAVSTDAIDRLLNTAPERAQRLSRKISAKLSSPDFWFGEKVFFIWSLARLRSRDAVPAIAALRAREPEWTKLARVADVALAYLKEGERPSLEAIASHTDHAHIEELCTLAWFVIKNAAARAALEMGAVNSPDDDCSGECRFALEKLKP